MPISMLGPSFPGLKTPISSLVPHAAIPRNGNDACLCRFRRLCKPA